MPESSGNIKFVKQRKDNYGILIGDVWYNSQGSCPAEKGDFVDIEYDTNDRGFNIISKINIRGEKTEPVEKPEDATSLAVDMVEYCIQEAKKLCDKHLTTQDDIDGSPIKIYNSDHVIQLADQIRRNIISVKIKPSDWE